MKSLVSRIDEHYDGIMTQSELLKYRDKGVDKSILEKKITSEKQFREWALKVLKNAHGDNFNQEIADKTINDLTNVVKDGNWGEAVGRLTSGLS